MEEESATAETRAQLKEDKTKFDKAMESILALEKSVARKPHDDDEDYEEMDLDGDVPMTPGSALGQSVYPSTLATGEVM